MMTWVIVKTVLGLLASVFFFYLVYLGFRSLKTNETLASLPAFLTVLFCTLFGLVAVGYVLESAHHSPIILCREMCDDVFSDQYYQPKREQVPKNLNVLCASDGPFGITIYHWKWCRLISIEEAINQPGFSGADMDVIVSHDNNKITLDNGKVFTLPKNVKTYTKGIAADRYWRQDHPNKVEGSISYLIWPKVYVNKYGGFGPAYGGNYWKDDAVIMEYVFR